MSAGLAVAACGSPGPATTTTSPDNHGLPVATVPTPPGVLATTAPTPNGLVWVLARHHRVATLVQVDLVGASVRATVGVDGSATDVSQSESGDIGLAISAGASGALAVLGASGATRTTVALPGPALRVDATADGAGFDVLTGTTAADAVSVVSSSGTVTRTVPVPADVVDLAAGTDGRTVWLLTADGVVSRLAADGRVAAAWATGRTGCRALALSPDGSVLYVLVSTPGSDSVLAVSTADGHVLGQLAAPIGTVDVALSPDGSTLYDAVSVAGAGNIQAFDVPAADR